MAADTAQPARPAAQRRADVAAARGRAARRPAPVARGRRRGAAGSAGTAATTGGAGGRGAPAAGGAAGTGGAAGSGGAAAAAAPEAAARAGAAAAPADRAGAGAGGAGGRGGSASGGTGGTGGSPAPTWDWVGVIGTGQSLAVGGHGNAPAMPVGGTTQRFRNLKLSLGSANVPPFDPNNAALSMVPLVETLRAIATGYPSPYPRNIYGQSFHTAMGDEITTLVMAGQSRDYVTAHTAVGEAGQPTSVHPEGRDRHRLDRTRLRRLAVRGRGDRASGEGAEQELRRRRDRADARRIRRRQLDVRGRHGPAVAELQPGPAGAHRPDHQHPDAAVAAAFGAHRRGQQLASARWRSGGSGSIARATSSARGRSTSTRTSTTTSTSRTPTTNGWAKNTDRCFTSASCSATRGSRCSRPPPSAAAA